MRSEETRQRRATGLSVTTAAGKPPLTVSNNVMNPKLNAQYLGGFAANGLGRVDSLDTGQVDFGGGPFALHNPVPVAPKGTY